MKKSKIERIEELLFPKYKDTVANLVEKLGYEDIQKFEDVIIASNTSPLSSEKYLFILFKEQLSGIVNIDEIKSIILKRHELHVSNVIYILSQFNISSGFESTISKEITQFKLQFIGRDRLIKLIDDLYSDFWKHDDLALLEYEKRFYSQFKKDTEINKLKIFNDKYQKLLDIYIEPRITFFYEDKATQTPANKKVQVHEILLDKKPVIISGDAGTGKSTFLKKVGELLIEINLDADKKTTPVYLTTNEIFEAEYLIENLILKKIEANFGTVKLDDFIKSYNIAILIDSIDELDDETQKMILHELQQLTSKEGIRYLIGTRNSEKIISLNGTKDFNSYSIEKFNNEQIKKFISKFFLGENNKADNLLEALKENRIIEKLPITPLTLSLISILYEENNLEIPATIADIYDNFNSLIIGRSTVSSKIEFIDISFKERILSLYALYLLEKNQHTPLLKKDFIEYFTKYFAGKTLPIKKGTLEEVLNYLIDNTGVLVLKDNKWVQFSHDSYMEYYGALEIFKHQREKESLLVDNFFENNWQNAAIFYAGKSKDLPLFLVKIIEKLKSSNQLHDYYSGVLGSGYILQALYQTDNQLRKNAILEALEMNIKATDVLMKLASDEMLMFKNHSIPIIQLMNFMYFYETFNSITIKEPLKLAFDETYKNFEISNLPVDGLKSIQLAMTLDSKRINEPTPLTNILESKQIFKEPLLYTILDFSFSMFGTEKYKKLKEEIRKEHFPKLKDIVKKLMQQPAGRLRFTNLDSISSNKKVQIIVEGKTDAEILEHAFYTLTNGQYPYWKVSTAGNNDSGGASEVAKTISSCKPVLENEEIIIGIFDHDAKGLQEFRGLKTTVFAAYTKDTIRKHINSKIFGLIIPVPGEMDYYLKKEQSFNFFEIEHYFGYDFLYQNDIIESTEIPEIYKIKDSKKKNFSKKVREQHESNLFRHFIDLFKQIDSITGMNIEYNED
jgi:hypothetical protein